MSSVAEISPDCKRKYRYFCVKFQRQSSSIHKIMIISSSKFLVFRGVFWTQWVRNVSVTQRCVTEKKITSNTTFSFISMPKNPKKTNLAIILHSTQSYDMKLFWLTVSQNTPRKTRNFDEDIIISLWILELCRWNFTKK